FLAAHPEVTAVEDQVVLDAHRSVEGVRLRDDTDHLFGEGRVADHVDPAYDGLAARRDHARREHPDGGRLPGAVRPQETVDLAFAHLQIERLHRLDRAGIRLRERLRRDDWAAGRGAAVTVAGDGAARPGIRGHGGLLASGRGGCRAWPAGGSG